ncbi:hypothetical protein D9M71_760340 [compost metagenome]
MYTVTPAFIRHEACFGSLQFLRGGIALLRLMLLEHGLHADLVELQRLPLV